MGRISIIRWHKYPMLFPLLCLIAGIILNDTRPFSISQHTFPALGITLLAVASLLLLFLRQWAYFDPAFNVLAGLLCMTLGSLCSHHRHHPNHRDWYGHYLPAASFIQLEIMDRPEKKARTIRYRTEVRSVCVSDSIWLRSIGYIDIYIYHQEGMPSLNVKDIISIPASSIRTILHNRNPHSFNYEKFAARRNKFHQAFLPHKDIIVNHLAEEKDLPFVKRTNKAILRSIYDNVSDSMTASMMAAVIINERADMDQEVWSDYSRTGVAHIIAISGMHITLFVSILFYLLFFIRHKRDDYIKYSIALILVWVYIMLTGLPPSAVRAGIMFTIMGIAIIIGRSHIAMNTLLATAFISLILSPEWLWDVGFQLSFLSVLAILLYFEPIRNLIKPRFRIIDMIWSTVAVSIAVQILLTPLLIYYFYQFTVWSVIANIPAALYSTLFMIITLLIIALGSLSVDMAWLGEINTFITIRFNAVIHFFSEFSPDIFYRLHIDGWQLLFSYLLIALLSLYFFKRAKLFLSGSAVVFVIMLAVSLYQYHLTKKQAYVCIYNTSSGTIIDVIDGHSLSRFHTQLPTAADTAYLFRPHEIRNNLSIKSSEQLSSNKSFRWKGRTFLILVKEWDESLTSEYAADYIIITDKRLKLTEEILASLRGKTWIISPEISANHSRRFKELFDHKNLNYNYIRESGAMIIE